jgi:hypothetical protein
MALVELYELIAKIEEEIIADCSVESLSVENQITEANVPAWAQPGHVEDFINILKGTAATCKTNTSKHGDIKKEKAVKVHEAHKITKDIKSLVKPIAIVKDTESVIDTIATIETKKVLKKP